jgi:hypothetical protein
MRTFQCKGIVNRFVRLCHDGGCERCAHRTMCAHNDRTFERFVRTMMARTYEHAFAPPAAPPKEELTYFSRGVRAQRAGRIFAATIEAAY